MSDVESRAREILGRNLKADPASLRPEDRLREDLGADSLDLVVILHEFEQTFDRRIPDEWAVDVRSVGDVFRGLQEGKAS